MKPDTRARYEARDHIMNLLSDDEVARVSTVEASPSLFDGDEYVDLEDPAAGVRRAVVTSSPLGQVIAKKAVSDQTWAKIVSHLPRTASTRKEK
jgi:hypothetical protein